MQLIFEQIRTGGDRNFGYLLADRDAKEGVLIDPSFSPRGDWRKFKCDVQSMWAHIHNKRDAFVSAEDNFYKPDKTSALVALGAGHIKRPQQAVALI